MQRVKKILVEAWNLLRRIKDLKRIWTLYKLTSLRIDKSMKNDTINYKIDNYIQYLTLFIILIIIFLREFR
jgi:hypothetical protein